MNVIWLGPGRIYSMPWGCTQSDLLRVSDLQAKPPFVDTVAGQCIGLLADMFLEFFRNSGIQYSVAFNTH
jgi:hypothetical protein